MADVRALLRNERLARRIDHPNAIYSSSGTLSCNICNLRLQADSLWEPHLAGKTHRKNLQRLQTASAASLPVNDPPLLTSTTVIPPATNGAGRKRKADDEDVEEAHINGKKRKAENIESEDETGQQDVSRIIGASISRSALPDEHSDTKTNMDVSSKQDEEDKQNIDDTKSTKIPASSTAAISGSSTVDDDEYAAFEAAIAAGAVDDESIQQPTMSVLISGADIAAAPVTAAELASREADELNQQRKGRDAEIEGEKEDAARALEEEFDEMDQLEARVKKLREMRERLRTTLSERGPNQEQTDEATTTLSVPESDDDDDDEYDDDWGFR